MISFLKDRLDLLPKICILLLSILLLLTIGVIDWSVRGDLGFSVFYIIPIAIVTWYLGRSGGILLCSFAAMVWLWAELNSIDEDSLLTSLWNTGIRLLIFWVVTTLLLSIKLAYSKQYNLARTDELTGATNYRAFQENIEGELKRAKRYHYPVSLAYIDIDKFKLVNDSFGHERGNCLLRELAKVISENVRDSDLLARIGGDEFAILMPQTNEKQAKITLKRLQKRLVELAKKSGFPIGFSIGLVACETLFPSTENIISSADKMMYIAKENNQDLIYSQIF